MKVGTFEDVVFQVPTPVQASDRSPITDHLPSLGFSNELNTDESVVSFIDRYRWKRSHLESAKKLELFSTEYRIYKYRTGN